MKKRFQHIAVLLGGVSSEREISLCSGEAVARGLRDGGYTVSEIDVHARSLSIPESVEAVFVALHGAFGEDGEIQQLLTDRKLPYTGSGPDSSRISFDKVLTREKLSAAGIPVPPGELLHRAEDRTLPFPLVVKPPREGSSVGCHIVRAESEWATAFEDAVRFSGEALVETFIPGRELTVGVLEGSETGSPDDGTRCLIPLPVVEIMTSGEWYDYDAKYVTGETTYSVPAELEPDVTAQLQEIAHRTFTCLGAEGFGRVDLRLSPEGTPYVLELNSIPGFTASSLLPKAAAAAGIGFSALCSRIIELASVHEQVLNPD